jgi:hypothetical protein
MRPLRTRLLLAACAAAVAAALPAFGQDSPESLLPPGFETPPPPKEEPRSNVGEPSPTPAETPPNEATPAPTPGADVPTVTDSAAEDLRALPPVAPSYTADVPEALRRPVDVVGVLDAGNWGLGANAFGTDLGAFQATLMRQLDAPVPSRWTSMLLRRGLMSRVPAPRGVHPVDWVAERAALLLRMGEADGARALVQSVDVANYTPLMIQVALDAALATSDPAALCPIIVPGRALGDQPVWRLADAICSALAGDATRASALIGEARNRGGVSGADLVLAEKLVGAGTNSRRAATVRWDEVDRLTPWRFGLAGASGMDIPAQLIRGAGPRFQAWYARAPMVPVEQRVDAAFAAAALGVFSSNALVEIHSLIFDRTDQAEVGDTPAGRLRTAFVHRDVGERMRALRDLWDDGEGPAQRYARRILTASAASHIPISADRGDDVDELIAAMLSAGLDDEAARWSDTVAAGDADTRAWGLLAVGAPQPGVDLSASSIEAYRDADDSDDDRRTRMLVAALVGLGRVTGDVARDFSVDLSLENGWTRAIDAAAQARHPGAVALLAAVGMQTQNWTGVPPAYLYRMVRALRAVGLDYEARMIAAEALARL